MRKAHSAPSKSLRGAPPAHSVQASQTVGCPDPARDALEAVEPKILFLDVSNGPDWAFGCLLHPNCQIPLLSHLDWQAFI